MPNPKTGTVVAPEDVGAVVKEVKGGRVDFRVERAGIVHASIGKCGMGGDKLRDNILSFISTLIRLKPASAKGTYIRSVGISPTMGAGIRLDPNELSRLAAGV
jgi:large subunit ribosomal protein L1